ncbi:TRAF3-interacting protein 1 [Chironomus tepperi]|uniref:TRAF3-interacting protein 1 n=1 Tax=Chironomus tepperi TaxID=113505 RepID=UPI00391EEDF7
MTENIDAEVIKRTQDALGKYVKKPPLTDKLLRKPPFKFILDIVKAVIRDTHFLEDLYTDDELNAEKDRDGKMKFLQKLIDVIKIVTQQDLQIKTSKVVAGLEAEKTNELFQALAYALDNKLDSKEAVSAVKNGAIIQMKGKPTKGDQKVTRQTAQKISNKTKETPPSRDRTPAKPEQKKTIASQRSIDKKTTTNLREKEKASTKEKVSSKTKAINDKNEAKKLKKVPSKELEVQKVDEKILTNGSLDSHKENSITPPRQNSLEKNEEPSLVITENHQPEPAEEEKKEEEEPKVNGDIIHNGENHLVNNSHAFEIEKEPENVKPQDELAAIIDEEAEYRRKEKTSKRLSSRHRQKSVENESQDNKVDAPQPQPLQEVNHQKPQSLAPQAEKIERFQSNYKRESLDRPRTSLRPPSVRPASSRPAAPRRRDKNIEIVLQPEENVQLGNIQVKMENFSKELEDDGENLVIIEDPSASNDDTNFINERMTKNISIDSSDTVQNDHGHLVQQILETEKNFEGALGMDGSEQGKKTEIEFDESRNQSNLKQIENLKDLIQKLVRSLNPLGKLMDYVQEDIDSMQREYGKWNEIYKQAAVDLKREQSETQAAIEPLRFQLNQLEKSIVEHHQLIDQLRGNLMMSENKINKIFTDV